MARDVFAGAGTRLETGWGEGHTCPEKFLEEVGWTRGETVPLVTLETTKGRRKWK